MIDHNANIENALEPSRRATDLDGGEGRSPGTVVDGDDVSDEESNSTDERIAETANGVNLDGDAGGLAGKKLRRDAEEELVVPGGVGSADGVDSGAEAVGGVDPGDGVGLPLAELVGGDLEALGGDEIDLEDGQWRGRGAVGSPIAGDLHGGGSEEGRGRGREKGVLMEANNGGHCGSHRGQRRERN